MQIHSPAVASQHCSDINFQGPAVDEIAKMMTLDQNEHVRKARRKVLFGTLACCVLILVVAWILGQRHKRADALMRQHFERMGTALNSVVETVPGAGVEQVGSSGGPVPYEVRKLKKNTFTISDLENLVGKPDSVVSEGESNLQSRILSWGSWKSGWDKKYSGNSRSLKAVFVGNGITFRLMQLEYQEHSPGNTTIERFGLSGSAWQFIKENF